MLKLDPKLPVYPQRDFKAGDVIICNGFSTFRLESDLEDYGYCAFAHARKLDRFTKEWGKVKEYTFQTDDMKLVGADVLASTEAA